MDHLDIYLYIILLVIYAVARLFKASGKRPPVRKTAPANSDTRQSAQTAERKKSRPFSFEDLLSEFEESFREKTAPQPQEAEPAVEEPAYGRIPESPSAKTKPASDPEYFTYEGSSYDDITPETPSPAPVSTFTRDARYRIDIRDKHPIVERLRKPGGLRDAVLLSEILNRKYF
jgi:hypothetical protein